LRSAKEIAKERGEDEFERVNVEEDNEEQDVVQENGEAVLQTVAAKEQVMFVPDPGHDSETDSESAEAAHRLHQFTLRLRHFQGDDQER
jgi:hypothetical protein